MMLEIVVISMSMVLFAVIFETLRRRRLSEGSAVLWIAVGLGAILLAVARPIFDWIARSAGVSYGPSLLFAIVAVFLVLLCFSLSMQIGRLEKRVKILARELALHEKLNPEDVGEAGKGR
jgi:hypothetical protein